MTEADLARPVVDVRDFETGKLEYEIYPFGEENVIIPVAAVPPATAAIRRPAQERILQIVRKFDPAAQVEIVGPDKAVVRVEKEVIPRLIGKGGIMITEIEESLGIRIEVESKVPVLGDELAIDAQESGNAIELRFDPDLIGKNFALYANGEFVVAAMVGRKGRVRFSKDSEAGRKVVNAFLASERLQAFTQR